MAMHTQRKPLSSPLSTLTWLLACQYASYMRVFDIDKLTTKAQP